MFVGMCETAYTSAQDTNPNPNPLETQASPSE